MKSSESCECGGICNGFGYMQYNQPQKKLLCCADTKRGRIKKYSNQQSDNGRCRADSKKFLIKANIKGKGQSKICPLFTADYDAVIPEQSRRMKIILIQAINI